MKILSAKASAVLVGIVTSGSAFDVSAQSAVSIYGAMDMGIVSTRGSLSRSNFLASGENYTSRIGFTGREDLGSGLYAGFDLEGQVNADSGEGIPSNSNNQTTGVGTGGGLTFNRYSILKLGGRFGELRLGRDYASQYRNRVDVDPFANQGITTSQAQVGTLGGLTNTRASNMVNYVTPDVFGGAYLVLNRYFGENQSNVPNRKDGSGQGFRVGYRKGAWLAGFSVAKTYYLKSATAGDTTSINAALAYDFGFVRLMGGVYRDKVERVTEIVGKGYVVGATAPAFGVGDVKVAFSRYGSNAVGSPTSSKFALGYVYNFSKRTVAYANVVHLTNSGGANASLTGSTTAANQASRGYEIGLRTLF